MQVFRCDKCGCDVEMPDDYERPMCCDGYMCGCMGEPIEPLLCGKCENRLLDLGWSLSEFFNEQTTT